MFASTVPQISISLAPPEEPVAEPYSPFPWVSTLEEDTFRPRLLTPPASPGMAKQLSPLRPTDSPIKGRGLERERFEAMLKASRERNVNVGAKKSLDLRKEIALRTHKSKQVERRALFLSKLNAPPDPAAINTPSTPPDSPALFYYTLPSPGLVSPLALFESLNDDKSGDTHRCTPWVEQVDFRLPKDEMASKLPPRQSAPPPLSPVKRLPSLDQITARLSSRSHVRTLSSESTGKPKRLPPFLQLDMHRRRLPTLPTKTAHLSTQFPATPTSPKLQVTTTVFPHTASPSSAELSERNLFALDSRAQSGRQMLSTLKRRAVVVSERVQNGHELEENMARIKRRISAPAEMESVTRVGFAHPALSMAGGF